MKTRYLVEWVSYADALAAAKAAGMPAGGALADYIDLDVFDRSDFRPTFAGAVALAREVLPLDVWASPRIRRQELVPNDYDDLGNRVPASPSFETVATWEVFADAPDPDESKPDWTD